MKNSLKVTQTKSPIGESLGMTTTLRGLGLRRIGAHVLVANTPSFRGAIKKVRGAKLHLLDGADHGFSVKKSTGRTKDDVYEEAVGMLVAWLGTL